MGFRELGGPDVLRLEEVPEPRPGPAVVAGAFTTAAQTALEYTVDLVEDRSRILTTARRFASHAWRAGTRKAS